MIMKEPTFSVKDMSALLSLSYRAINKRIQDLNLHSVYKENNMRYFSKESYVKVANYNIVEQPIIYEQIIREITWYVVPSKMNYLPDEML